MNNLIVFMTPRIIQNSDDIDATIKDSMRDYRSRLKKDWNDIFPEDILPKDFRKMGEDQIDEEADEVEKMDDK